jgi:hypothetical protein
MPAAPAPSGLSALLKPTDELKRLLHNVSTSLPVDMMQHHSSLDLSPTSLLDPKLSHWLFFLISDHSVYPVSCSTYLWSTVYSKTWETMAAVYEACSMFLSKHIRFLKELSLRNVEQASAICTSV